LPPDESAVDATDAIDAIDAIDDQALGRRLGGQPFANLWVLSKAAEVVVLK
jgi:hypothetical protein